MFSRIVQSVVTTPRPIANTPPEVSFRAPLLRFGPSRFETRNTWVSTTRAGMPKELPSTTFAAPANGHKKAAESKPAAKAETKAPEKTESKPAESKPAEASSEVQTSDQVLAEIGIEATSSN